MYHVESVAVIDTQFTDHFAITCIINFGLDFIKPEFKYVKVVDDKKLATIMITTYWSFLWDKIYTNTTFKFFLDEINNIIISGTYEKRIINVNL